MAEQTPEQARRAAELCHCDPGDERPEDQPRHTRDRHDPCSLCGCPFFRPAERVRATRFPLRPAADPATDKDREDELVAAHEAQAGWEADMARQAKRGARRKKADR